MIVCGLRARLFFWRRLPVTLPVEQAGPGLAVTASVEIYLRSLPAQCPCCTTGMCASDHSRGGGRSAATCHVTLLPGRTPRHGGRRYRRRDGVCRFGGRRRRFPAHVSAIYSPAGCHFSSPRHSRGQRLTHSYPGEGGHVAVAVCPSHPPPFPLRPISGPPEARRRSPRELSPPSLQ